MRYRADIDGLRAVAIVLVLVYHGGLNYFPSGYIGVDVFFVISGYLIASILSHSLDNNCFSLSDFYKRRLWRLQPVLLCFLMVVTVLTFLFFLPDDLIQYYKSARKVSIFEANAYFKKTTSGYFAPDSFQLPLLHTWSLAIEWQFYFIFPLVLYALNRLCKKHFMPVIYTLTISSFVLTLYYSVTTPAQSYYLLSGRFFEFLIGACIAFRPCSKRFKSQILSHSVALLALFILVGVALQHDILLGYPNWYTLLVCVATATLIWLGSVDPENWIIRGLSLKPVVTLGILSYSLYIWHWMFFALLRYNHILENGMTLTLTYSIIFLVSYLSWRFIEVPARLYHGKSFVSTVLLLVIVPCLMIHLMSLGVRKFHGFPQRFNDELVTIYKKLDDYENPSRPLCIKSNFAEVNPKCMLGANKSSSLTALMIGDSFSNHYWGFMDVLAQEAHVSILASGISSCLTLPGIYLYDWWHFKDKVYQDCYTQTAYYYDYIKNSHFDFVIIGQIWSNYIGEHVINKIGDERSVSLSKKRVRRALEQALINIIKVGARPVLIKTSALMQENFHDCFFKHIKLRTVYDQKECSFKQVDSDSEHWLSHLFKVMKSKYPQLIIIDPKKVQCQNGLCQADINGIPIYRDVGHLTDYASYQFGINYLKKFTNPLRLDT